MSKPIEVARVTRKYHGTSDGYLDTVLLYAEEHPHNWSFAHVPVGEKVEKYDIEFSLTEEEFRIFASAREDMNKPSLVRDTPAEVEYKHKRASENTDEGQPE
jgi:hypothetical protein